MSRTNHKAKKRKSARRSKRNSTAYIRGIDREIQKENGTLIISRGRHAIHTSRKDKRRSRRSDRRKAIDESSD